MFFSIITVTRNNRAGLAKTAESIVSQHFKGYEWIIIDGDSTDGTPDDFPNYNAAIVSEPDLGIYDAMNKGIDRATGDYLVFMNAGDQFADAEALKIIHDAASPSMPDFIYGDAWETSGSEKFYKPAKPHLKYPKGMFTHHQSMIYKRSQIGAMRYDLRYKIASDYDFTVRLLTHKITIFYLNKAICIFEAGGVSQKNAKTGRLEQFIIRRRNKILSLPASVFLYFFQCLSCYARAIAPGIYWALRSKSKKA